MQVWMVFGAVFALEKFLGKFCKKLGKFHHDFLATLPKSKQF